MVSRRRLLMAGAGLAAVGAGITLFRSFHSLRPPDPEASLRFRTLQDAVLTRYGVPPRSRLIDISKPRMSVHVIEAGEGAPLVLIHGGNSVAAGWSPLLARLQQRFQVFAPDRPGCGLSSQFLYTGVPLREHAVSFVGAVLDGLGLERPAVVGNSMGGYFALVYALANPQRVSKLVLIGEPAGSPPQIRFRNRLIGTRIINSALFATVLKPGPGTMRKSFESMLVADVNRVPPDLLQCLTAGSMIPGAAESWITLNEGVYNPAGAGIFSGASTLTYALRPELHKLQIPVLFLWGDKDTFGPPSLGAEMAGLLPNGRCEVIRDAGHLAWLDQLDQCAEAVEAFVT